VSAESIKLAKKTRLQRYLFPQQDVNRHSSTPDLFQNVRKRSDRFLVSDLNHVKRGPTRNGSQPSRSTTDLLAGAREMHATPWKPESAQYGARENDTPERMQKIRKDRQRRNKISRQRRTAHRESSPPKFLEYVQRDERRLRTLVQQRLGYYETLQARDQKGSKL
jgi:hypothetical protein